MTTSTFQFALAGERGHALAPPCPDYLDGDRIAAGEVEGDGRAGSASGQAALTRSGRTGQHSTDHRALGPEGSIDEHGSQRDHQQGRQHRCGQEARGL